MLAAGMLGLFAMKGSFPPWRHPLVTLPVAASIPLWWYARSFYRSIRARREEEAGSPPRTDESG
jgi:hypothetical protein